MSSHNAILMTNAQKGFLDIARLSGGFIGSEPLFFLLMILASSVCGILGTVRPDILVSNSVSLMIIERGIQLSVLYFITRRWKQRLSIQRSRENHFQILIYGLVGYCLWFSIMGPLIGLTMIKDGSFLLLFLLGVGCYLSLQFYFIHIPLIIGSLTFRQSLGVAKEIIQFDRLLPIKIIGSASGITILLYAIISAPFPDGRSMLFTALAQLASALFWVLSSYLSLAAACLALSDKYWHEWKLDPYRSSRFETLSKHGSSIVTEILSPKGSIIAIMLGCMCLTANFFRSQDIPPPATIIVESTTVNEDTVTIKLNLSDDTYSFRGTSPMNFALAGESRSVISPVPEVVTDSITGEDKRFFIPNNQKQERITLSFKADRSGDALVALKDLYLWYRNVKIAHLELKKE